MEHVDGLPAQGFEEVGQDSVHGLVVALAIRRREDGARVALVQSVCCRRDVVRLPAMGPFIVEVMVRRVDEDHVVERHTTTQHTACAASGVIA